VLAGQLKGAKTMPLEVTNDQVEAYLSTYHGRPVRVLRMQQLGDKAVTAVDGDATEGGVADAQPLKRFGYGKPIVVHYKSDHTEQRVVLRMATANGFGHELRADRAAELLLGYDTYNALPLHVGALDVGVFRAERTLSDAGAETPAMISLGAGDEFFLLTPYAEGEPYALDLQRLRDEGNLLPRDVERCQTLADYLVQIHSRKYVAGGGESGDSRPQKSVDRAALYRRRIRDTIGSGEGILGLVDCYPRDYALATPAWLEMVEKECIRWRWRLKGLHHRLCQVHGDFHPFNILFAEDNSPAFLDRSRGEWGEPADDVSCLAINYLFFSLQRSGQLSPPFEQLWELLWQRYLDQTGDRELLRVVAPFLVWRALVLASPIWYETPDRVRRALLHLIERVLHLPSFDPSKINELCGV
jgi:hypothetical protein